jgi:hypothetical protein
MDTNPKAVGERSEAQVIAKLLQAGKVVLTPFGDSQRYDLVVEEDGSFIRVQCKTARKEKGSLVFSCCSTNWNKGTRRDYRGQADLFAVYSPDTEAVYLVPVQEVGVKAASLRVDPSHQRKNIRWASDYVFDPDKSLTSLMRT